MGASESSLTSSREDGITTVSERTEGVDPILERLKSLKITTPILSSAPAESTLTDILVRKPVSSSTSDNESLNHFLAEEKCSLIGVISAKKYQALQDDFFHSYKGTLDPNVLLELFTIYRDWQEENAQKINKRQSEIENKIEVADALSMKLLQRYNYSVSAIKTTANHLSEVHALQVELGELKGRLTEVISNCDALCKRITNEGPESLQSSIKPLAAICTDQMISSVLKPVPSTAEEENQPSAHEQEQ